MKKILSLLFLFALLTTQTVYAGQSRYSREYLAGRKHFSVMNPMVEGIAEHEIKKSLKKETNADFDVKFTGYTLSSMKKGIFKYVELTGRDIYIEEIPLPYVNVKSISDYNYVDYTKNPIVFKSDMEYEYNIHLTEDSINTALKKPEYNKSLEKINSITYKLFQIEDVKTRIANGRIYMKISFNTVFLNGGMTKHFFVSTKFKVENGRIKASDIQLDNAYTNISLNKVANLVNLLNPLEFTLNLIDSKKCDTKIENLEIAGNQVRVNGKIYVKGE